ncbi:hypothetical protein HPP92_028497 [Vanilla planifolia]|uniref:Uncharacterized protein n=1 Tax=Vanilla planifolia TaxID=51239 RepID=A0A835P7V9_VANPL|nr:hypothetical protein HPP92_028497 [Vanilla planifolia]KAG0447136.1 hypothetical protein HPP92_028496 [Vanilla planifolia]
MLRIPDSTLPLHRLSKGRFLVSVVVYDRLPDVVCADSFLCCAFYRETFPIALRKDCMTAGLHVWVVEAARLCIIEPALVVRVLQH